MLKIKIKDIEFKSPIIAASGTLGYGDEISDFVDSSKLGGIITKSITLNPRDGNPSPRIHESKLGMINSIGLANIGVYDFCSKKIPVLNSIATNIIVSVAGSTLDDYVKVVKEIEKSNGNHIGYEINISCPNTKEGGMEFGVNKNITKKLTSLLRKITDKFLIIKLSPNVTSIQEIAIAAQEGGADAISAINTVIGMSIDVNTRKVKLFTKYGGLSGPAIHPIAVANVHKISKAVSIPIIGIGGVSNANDVIEFILAGADLVQIGTMNYLDPNIGVDILGDIKKYCKNNNIIKLSDIKGKVEYYDN